MIISKIYAKYYIESIEINYRGGTNIDNTENYNGTNEDWLLIYALSLLFWCIFMIFSI